MSVPQPLVIVPTYNEKDNIERLIDAVRDIFPEAELLVIDDNSPDGTAMLVRRRAQGDGAVHLLE